MAVGRLGVANPATNTNTLVYTVPSGVYATVNVCVVNMGLQAASFTLYVSDGVSTSPDKLYESNTSIPGNGGVLERGGFVCSPGETVYVSSNSPNLSIRVHGFED